MNAPPYRIWPPIALGVPLGAGLVLTVAAGDPFSIASSVTRWVGGALVVAFALWNGWTLSVMASHRTAILPGGATNLILQSGPFRLSRNPLYVGLIALDVALALLTSSFWALVLAPRRHRCHRVGRDSTGGALPVGKVRRGIRGVSGQGSPMVLRSRLWG